MTSQSGLTRSIWFGAIAAAAVTSGCAVPSDAHVVASSRTAVRPVAEPPARATPPPSFAGDEGWEVVLADEFDGGLDDELWNTCHWWSEGDGCQVGSSGELEWYVPEQVDVRDGALVLTADRSGRDDHPFVSGMVQSGPPDATAPANFAFLYGAVEARVRLPAGAGLWPAVWMLPTSTRSRPEIDILELYGQEPHVFRMHLHWTDEHGEPQQRGEHAVGVDLTQGWHTVGVRWDPGVVVWYLDGVERWRQERDEVAAEPMYLVLNLAVGGDTIGPPTDDVRFPAEMRVDWVRVWQRATSP